MPYCTSCGQPIPEGQGRSCSMCYGDPDHGRDGYYRKFLEDAAEAAAWERAQEEQEEEQP
jgi:hypothetical protein